MGQAGAQVTPAARRSALLHGPGRWLARRPGALAAASGILAAALLAHATPLVERLDEMAFDFEVALARQARDPSSDPLPDQAAPPPATPEVVLVGIDDDSLDALGLPLAMIHAEIGAALTAIAGAGPRAIGLDLALPQQSFDPLLPGLDRELMRGLLAARAGAGGVVLALDADAQGRLRVPALALVAAAGGPGSFGLTYFPLDCDGIVRRYEPDPGWLARPLPCQGPVPAAAAREERALSESVAAPASADAAPVLATFAARIAARVGADAPLRRAGWIDFTRGAPLAYVPLHRVVEWGRQGATQRLRERFAGRIVLVGSVLPDLDRLRLPVALAGWDRPSAGVPGLIVHAQVLRNALAHGLLHAPPAPLPALLVAATAALALARRAAWRYGLALAALPLLLVGGAGLQRAGVFCAPADALLGGACAVALRTALDLRREAAARRRLSAQFGRYLSPQVLRALLREPGAGAVTRRSIALLFADLRDFTAWSERTDPALVLETLNRYYGAVTPVLHAHGGVIDNFRGDGIMIMFGAPEPRARPCDDAFAAVAGMLEAIERLNRQQVERGAVPLALTAGLSYGEVVYGDLGSAERKDYTALGDAVNVAARLQELAKRLGATVLMTQDFARQLAPGQAGLRDLGLHELKGHSPVAVWGWRPPPSGSASP
jgi:class 3 adenylate cyclase